jgi:pyrroloquinoline quinone (PQQ) biosynthesis protein C
MPRDITTERLYYLGEYRNVKFIDSISNLPDEIAFNGELTGTLRWLQLVHAEKTFFRYMNLRSQLKDKDAEECLAIISKLHEETLLELKELFKNGEIESTTEVLDN